MSIRIGEMTPDERPRERLAQQGAQALKTSELIAILLRTGTRGMSALQMAENLLHKYPNLETLSRTEIADLRKIKGIGPAKAIQLKAAFALGGRLARSLAEDRPMETPADVHALLGEEMRQLDRESVRVILVNTKLKLVAVEEVTRGILNESLFHPREVLRPALTHLAYGFILVHNHPSGDPAPSRADAQVTRQMKDAAELLQIKFLDHLIIGAPRQGGGLPYYSFKEHGEL